MERFQKSQCFLDCHIQDIVDTFVFVFHFQRFSVITFTLAHFTWNIDICQEMHLDLDDSVTAARLTASALDVKTETSFLVTSCLRICSRGKKISNLVKNACIRCRIGPRCTSDRRLIDIDDLIKLVKSLDFLMFARDSPRTV